MQITEKTVPRQSSSKRKSRRLSGKLHCLNFVFPAENETLGPVCLGCEASSSSVSLSMLKVPIVSTSKIYGNISRRFIENSHRHLMLQESNNMVGLTNRDENLQREGKERKQMEGNIFSSKTNRASPLDQLLEVYKSENKRWRKIPVYCT